MFKVSSPEARFKVAQQYIIENVNFTEEEKKYF